MARTRKKELPESGMAVAEADTSFNPSEFDPTVKVQADEIIHGLAESTRLPDMEQPSKGFASQHSPSTNGHAAAVEKKQYPKAPDPFGTESHTGDDNRVRLLKSMTDRAWIIRFYKNPNEMTDGEGVKYSKERPHPVLKMLKEEGYRWGFADADSQGGWGKLMQEGDYNYAEHMEARKTLAKAAEMIGAQVEQGAGIPD